jgi:hypothetical protein
MKKIYLLFLLFFSFQAMSQIIGNKVSSIKKLKNDTNSCFYFEAIRFNSSRDLAVNSDFLAKPLGERAFETSYVRWGFTLGMTLPISKVLFFEGGLSYLRNGEQYSWKSSENDSSFSYQTSYSYISMPLQVKIQGGLRLKYFLATGLQPQLFQSFRQKQQWTNDVNTKYSATLKDNSDLNSFVISWITTAGLALELSKLYGIRISAQYRNQLNSSYLKTGDYIHKANGLGFAFGLTRKL